MWLVQMYNWYDHCIKWLLLYLFGLSGFNGNSKGEACKFIYSDDICKIPLEL